MIGGGVVLVPHTGEALALTDETAEHLADVVSEVRLLESQLRELKLLINEEIHVRMDKARLWTIETSGYKITGKSDALVSVWDAPALLELLDDMVASGAIDTDAMHRAIQPRTEYKVLAAGVNALLKNPKFTDALEDCRTLVEPSDRRISISRRD